MKYTNKQRCLVLASRGISYRTRHLMKDLEALMPQYKKDVKKSLEAITEIAELKSCTYSIFFEVSVS